MILMPINKENLYKLVEKQLSNNLIYDHAKERDVLIKSIDNALENLEFCLSFGGEKKKYWKIENKPVFNVFNTDQYSMFLYFLSHILYKEFNMSELATKIYYLNKIFHGVDVYFEVEMPDIFFLDHPVGTVLGRAKYSNFFGVGANCTVGNNKRIYPSFGHHVQLFVGSIVLGDCKIGNYCLISARTFIKDQDIPDNSVVFGESPNLIIKELKSPFFKEMWTE